MALLSVANKKEKKTGLRKSVGSQWEILKYAKWARLWMVLNAGLGNVVFDVSKTLILNEHFHIFFILDDICCVKTTTATHTFSTAVPLWILMFYIYLLKLRDY